MLLPGFQTKGLLSPLPSFPLKREGLDPRARKQKEGTHVARVLGPVDVLLQIKAVRIDYGRADSEVAPAQKAGQEGGGHTRAAAVSPPPPPNRRQSRRKRRASAREKQCRYPTRSPTFPDGVIRGRGEESLQMGGRGRGGAKEPVSL